MENPDLVRCDRGGVWRILTPEQIRKKFAHLGAIAKKKKKREATPAIRRSMRAQEGDQIRVLRAS